MMSEKNLETLEAWCRAKEFCVRVYREVLPSLPTEEKWNLGQQLRRAALSVPANIAEGYGRFYYQDNVRFCYYARGSLQECLSHLIVAAEMQFISDSQIESLRQDAQKLTRLLNGYISYLKKSKQGENEPGAHSGLAEAPGLYDAGGALMAPATFAQPYSRSPVTDNE